MSSAFQTGSSPIRNFIAVHLIDNASKYIPLLWNFVIPFCKRRSKVVELPKKEIQAEVLFERLKEDKNIKTIPVFQNRMDSVIYTISKHPDVNQMLSIMNHDYLPYVFNPVLVEPDIYFQLMDIKHDNGNVEMLKFKLFSYEHNSPYIQSYIDTCNSAYERHMANKLGNHLYFFDMMVQKKAKGVQNPLPENILMFTKHRFQTSRTFENVFFDQKQAVQNHTEFFLNRRDWYEKKGIPYTLGFMFHGEPGCGKTSTIKAIANVGRRHIINLHLAEIKTKTQLQNLFFNDEIQVLENGKTERYNIPVSERMYVIEDIDAMGDIVLRREWKKPEKKEIKFDAFGNIIEEETQIDLSFLLNLLDGTLETSGRIIAISTNFPERIDRALIRPGRIDMIIHFKKCSVEILREMIESFYDTKIELSDDSLNEKWSPAEVNQILFRNFKDKEKAITELKTLTSTDLYGFTLESAHIAE